jgi:hypothetical protein
MFFFKKKKPDEEMDQQPAPAVMPNNVPDTGDLTRYDRMVETLANSYAGARMYWHYTLNINDIGRDILALPPKYQYDFVQTALIWLMEHDRKSPNLYVKTAVLELTRKNLPFDEQGLIRLLDWSITEIWNFDRGIQQIIHSIRNYQKKNECSLAITERVDRLIESLSPLDPSLTRWQGELQELVFGEKILIPLYTTDDWAKEAIRWIDSHDRETETRWRKLLNHCVSANGSAPSAKWMKVAEELLGELDISDFKIGVTKWLSDITLASTAFYQAYVNNARLPAVDWIDSRNTEIIRAVIWLMGAREDRDLARTLTDFTLVAYHKLPGCGPMNMKLGNACIWALGNMPGTEGIGRLAILKVKISTRPAQRAIEKAFNVATERLNLPIDDIEELSVPTYGLDEVGIHREIFGDYTAEIRVTGKDAAITWSGANGKTLSAAPKAVKETYTEELAEFNQALKDIRKMLPAQSMRIENLYLENKVWSYAVWKERYLDHPLVGTLARRLIWKFSRGDQASSGIWLDGRMVSHNGGELDWIDSDTQVALWHPISVDTGHVLAWRDWLELHQVQQPFKQAHREVYLLTDAERTTRVYSNRFAAHIIKQHQFHALCGARGWKYSLRLMVDSSYPPASRLIRRNNLRAEYWVQTVGDHYGTDTNETGTYLYLATDQVRFYHETSQTSYAHAYRGRYGYINPEDRPAPIPLDEIPSLVFSEIMRDVDLFVGVASVGNDPNWMDAGRDQPQQNYWHNYSFGDLTEIAKTRRAILEKLVPNLAIARQCTLTDRFLVVEGNIRTYKIHLGSGNILMEPNDQYLCIVPFSGIGGQTEKIYLPFEGDQTLSVILSKALLLANDQKITDPVIVQQIKRYS